MKTSRARISDEPSPTWLWWSTGKDSAWTLRTLRASRSHLLTGLITTFTPTYQRVAIHGTRISLLEAQAAAVGLPLHLVPLPVPCDNDAYEAAVAPALVAARDSGVRAMAFGDLFLDDVRAYRERLLQGSGLRPEFPLWGLDTSRLARDMVAGGVDAVVVSLDPARMPREMAGRRFAEVLPDLPADVDPCGERGEFHTCVLDGPGFLRPLDAAPGEVVEREGFVFVDLVPAT